VAEIGAVARELGVSPSTLRTWERRYRLVVPERGANGQRLYDPEQVLVLKRVAALLRRGARAHAAHRGAAADQPIATTRLLFEPGRDAAAVARQGVDALLDRYDNPQFVFNVRLIASELVSNTVRYRTREEPVTLELKVYAAAVELRVQIAGGRLSIKRLRSGRRSGERGLDIVDALAESWSIETGPFGTSISVRLADEGDRPPAARKGTGDPGCR
jgi:hypothetical protein